MPAYSLLPALLDPRLRPGEPADPGAVKAALARLGVQGRGWRLYLDFGDALFAPLSTTLVDPGRPFSAARNAVAYLRLLQACEMDVLPPLYLAKSLTEWGMPAGSLDRVPPLFFRAAWKGAVAASYEERPPAGFIAEEVVPVARWFFACGLHEEAEPGLLKAGWPALRRRHREWLASQPQIPPPAPAVPGGDEWNPYVRRVEYGFYAFHALTTAAQLAEEGEVLNHCVGVFAGECLGGGMRIYSVRERKSGLRVGTFSVALVEEESSRRYWDYDQISGPRNAEVPAPMMEAADAVLRALGDLPRSTFPQAPKSDTSRERPVLALCDIL